MKKIEKYDVSVPLKECEPLAHSLGGLLLDSSLISTTKLSSLYNIKVVDCNKYLQFYILPNKKVKKHNYDDFDLNLAKIDLKKDKSNNLKKNLNSNELKTIELKNIIRSKLKCQRLAKCNSEDWHTFITLTFAENITDILYANKKFNNFCTIIKRVFKDFKYICVPEFQKRGAIHYHLLTNIDIDNKKLIFQQEDNKKFYHIKYWNNGFTKVDFVKGDIKKIIGYISKYMTKNIDNKLFSHHRYFYSKNLLIPKESYLNLDYIKHKEFFNKLISNKSIIYSNEYINSYNNEKIEFIEYLENS